MPLPEETFPGTRRAFLKVAGAATALPFAGCAGCSAEPASDAAAKIVIVGGGSAGLSVAARLVRCLPRALVTVVDPAERHYYQPGFTFIGAGVWRGDDVWMREEDLMPRGVAWKRCAAAAIEPDRNTVVLADGSRLTYDFLVLCPGLHEDWTRLEGVTRETLGAGNAHSIYDFGGAQKTWTALERFARTGGRGLFTDTWTKHKCGGAPKKICLLCEHLARRNGTRGQLSFKYMTASKELYDVPHYTPRLLEIYRERDIPITLHAKLVGVDTAAKRAHFEDRQTKRRWTEDYDFLHFAPPQSAPDFVKKSGLSWQEGKLAADGWVAVDKTTLVHLRYGNVLALGDVAGIPTSKTSAAIRKQAPVVVQNLRDLAEGRAPSAAYDGYAACPIITDYGHVLMAEFDYAKRACPSFPFSWLDTARELRSAWWLKVCVLKPLYFKLMLRGYA